jgi:uncharacterized protein
MLNPPGTPGSIYAFSSYSGSSHEQPSKCQNRLDWYIGEAIRERYGGSASTYAFGSYGGHGSAVGAASLDEEDSTPRPFVHFVAKVASRCNIKCSYCYMYEHADQAWRTQPIRMSDATETAMIARIDDYLTERAVSEALVILHGGEPLLYGPKRISRISERIRALRDRRGLNINLAVQTNATMVDDAFVEIFARNQIFVGVSLDGPAEVHDAKRRDKLGMGTHERALKGLQRLMASTAEGMSPPAITAVIDPATRPQDVVEYFLDLGVEHVDFQLPDDNHDTYPHEQWPVGTFGTWLIDLYEVLRRIRRPLRVRSMELLIRLILGAPYGGDILGTRSFGTLVIDTDGAYHAHDALKGTFDGATALGRSVHSDGIQSLEADPMVLAFTDKTTAAASTCRRCPVFSVCGGGLVAHRYSAARGFDNTSVYCVDLKMLILHVRRSLEHWQPQHADLDPHTALRPV